MSNNDRSENVILLRAAIARIEAGAQPPAGGLRPLVRLGERLALDAALGGGLAAGSVSEIVPAKPQDAAAACGFALGLAIRLARSQTNRQCRDGRAAKPILWIIEDFAGIEHGAPYGPGLAQHGLAPHQLVLVRTPRAQDALWALEEALKTRNIIVIGELWTHRKCHDLAASRRLALAARASGTPGLILHAGASGNTASAAASRFEIASHASATDASATDASATGGAASRLPVPGSASWAVRLLKARAGPESRFGLDRDKRHFLVWDAAKGFFRDALPVPAPAHAANRPYFAAAADLAKTA